MIDVSILGATGMVGQRFIELLADHPWFRIKSVFASEKKRGKKYKDSVQWVLESDMPDSVKELPILSISEDKPERVILSSLPSEIAFGIEEMLSKEGYFIFSNASSHRYDEFVPIVVPEVNPDHIEAVRHQGRTGFIVTNPNCSTTGLVLTLKPILNEFGIKEVIVFTMQAISGAGFPGVPSLSILDNVIPFIEKEEEKIKIETKKILGRFDERFIPEDFKVYARSNRVMVRDGHMEVVFLKTDRDASIDEFKRSFVEFKGIPQNMDLPSAPKNPIILLDEPDRPQPLFDRLRGRGMSVSVGRVEKIEERFFTFTLLSHNTIRGAAGGSILNLETALKLGYLRGLDV